MWDMMSEGTGVYMVVGGLFMLVILGWLIAFITWGTIGIAKRNNTKPHYSPLDIAKGRYAKGEIKKEEFEQIKMDLQ